MLTRRGFLTTVASIPAFLTTRGTLSATPMKESRVIFCEGPSWFGSGTTNAELMCDKVKRAGFNAMLAYIWHGNGVTWPSRLVSQWSDARQVLANPIAPGEDPLATLIDVAHARGIEVHACFTVMLRRGAFFPEFHTNVEPDKMFDAHNPAFREFIVAVMTEVVEGYSIDGLALDYIRSGDGFYQNPDWVREYKADTGRDLQQDLRLLHAEKKKGESHPEAHALFDWQELAVGDIVRRMCVALRRRRPNAVLSVYGNPFDFNGLMQGRDPAKWADEGTIDVIYGPAYGAQPDWEEIRRRQLRLKRPGSYVAVCNNYDVDPETKKVLGPRDAGKVSELLQQSRTIGRENGVALYLYRQLTEEQVVALSEGAFRDPAVPSWYRASESR